MRNRAHKFIGKSAALLGIMLATAPVLTAQALVAGERGVEIAPFAQYALLNPDWGQTNNFGYTAGLDYTRFIRSSFIQPSLEFRYTRANGQTVNERSYTGGFKLQTTVHNIYPYATILVGHGNIDFNYPNGGYQGDNALIYAFGGGAEFNVTQCWKLRLDFSSQHWNLGNYPLTPFTLGVGIAYRLPISNHRRVQ